MKLRNKLIPLTGIATIAATVTPLGLTSCSNKIDMVDITRGFIPTTKSSIEESLGQFDANKTYLTDVKNNSKIFHDDFLYGANVKFNQWRNEFLSWVGEEGDNYYIQAANAKINSMKAGLTNPTFSSTKIRFPGEPTITYPTISFQYNIEIDYTYEYVGYLQYEDSGYHKKDNTISMSVEYKNVPFLVFADYDMEGRNNLWTVTPIHSSSETISSNSTKYYYQTYMFQYMEDDWSINVNATRNQNEKLVSRDGSYEYTDNGEMDAKIDTYALLTRYVENETVEDGYDILDPSNLVSMLSNFEFKSFYLDPVKQLAELQPTGEMSATANLTSIITETTALDGIGSFYLPQTFAGTITLKDIIELTEINATSPMKITIPKETAFVIDGTSVYFPESTLTIPTARLTGLTAGQYNFAFPAKYITVTFTPATGTAWTQDVYLNQDTLPLILTE